MPDDQAAAARELETKARSQFVELQERQHDWRCAYCTGLSAQPRAALRAHLRAW